MRTRFVVSLLALSFLMYGCFNVDFAAISSSISIGGGGGGGGGFATTDVTLSAGMTEIQPEQVDTLSGTVNASRFGVGTFDRVYDLETPAGTDFAFNLVARGAGNWGLTRINLGHVEAAGVTQTAGAETIAANGMTLEAPGMANAGNSVDINGDGFSRVTVRGNISAEQVLIARVPLNNDVIDIGIRVRIGNSSAINLSAGNPQGFRAGMTTTDLYSSDSPQFGLPSLALSGDRYSVVAYDGDPTTQTYVDRNRRWLQLDTTTSAVTGGEAQAYSPDSGFWRDQEVAALGNVLAVAYTGSGQVRAEVSLNRGGSFPIVQQLDPAADPGTRLVQMAIAPNYTLGVLYWKNVWTTSWNCSSHLMLIEAVPSGFDANNTPTGYVWGAPTAVHNAGYDVTPLLMYLEYSQGNDLVIGYGYTSMLWNPGSWTITSSARYRCAVRQSGSQGFYDVQIDQEDNVMPCDPHVCVLGSGASLEIFYTYERTNGVRLYHSTNAGATFQLAYSVPIPGAMQPSVHARMQNGSKRVDLLYVSPAGWGLELHDLTWDDFGTSTPALSRITQSTAVAGGTPPAGMPQGYLITTLAWMGYDAVLKGDDVAIAYHELTYDSYEYYSANWSQPAGGAQSTSGGTTPPPTVLLPGLTGTVPTPDPNHRNQLRVAVID